MTGYRVLLIFLFFSSVVCENEDCVTFDFEKDFNSSFSNEIGVCDEMIMWNVGNYEDLPIDSPDPDSSKFVYPSYDLSCASSFTFPMKSSGVLEVNLFMKPTSNTDQVTILASQIIEGGQDVLVGFSWIIASDDNFVSGWRTVRLTLTGSISFNGYITILGMAATESIVLVDSFRYISPSIEEEDCIIYQKVTTISMITTETQGLSTEKETNEPSSPYTTRETQTDSVMTSTVEDPEITDTTSPVSTVIISTTKNMDTTTVSEITKAITESPDSTTVVQSTTNIISEATTLTEPQTTKLETPNPNQTTTTQTDVPENYSSTTSSVMVTTQSESTTNSITDDPITSPVISTETGTMSTLPTSETDNTASNNPTTSTGSNKETTTVITSQMTTTSISSDATTTYSTSENENTQITTHPETTTVKQGEAISTAEDIGSPTTEQTYTTTTDENTSTPNSENTTKNPPLRPGDTVWNAFTITMVILLILIIIVFTAGISYYCGEIRSPRESQIILPYFEEPPKTLIIPRVTKVWTDSSTINRLSSIIKME